MKHFSFAVLFTFFGCALSAQSDPEPFDLSSGTYVLNNWPAAAPAGSYPANMVFQVYDNLDNNPGEDAEIIGDWLCRYDIESRSRILGEGPNGFSFINTGNTQDDQERCGGEPLDVGGYVGAALLALNTTGVEDVSGSYLATKLTLGSGLPPREYVIRLEYRTGTEGAFTPVEGTELSSDDYSVDDPQLINFTLPADASNQNVVQIRWRYFQREENDGGQRPQWRVGAINVSGLFTSVVTGNREDKGLGVFPNPSADGNFTLNRRINGSIFDMTGKMIDQVSNADRISLVQYAKGIYLLKTEEGTVIKLVKN